MPTEKAYRYYVDRTAGCSPPLAPDTQEYIRERLRAEGGVLDI